MTSSPSYATCPTDLGDRLDSHARFTLSIGTSVKVGRQLKLARTDLGSTKLTRRNLRRVVLQQCRLFCTDMRGVDAVEAEFNGSDMTAADLSEGNFAQALMRGVDLSRAILNNTRFDSADFRPYTPPENVADGRQETKLGGASARGASFVAATLNDTIFDKANLQDANFAYASITGLSLKGADLRGADFSMADMPSELGEQIISGGGKVPKAAKPAAVYMALESHASWVQSDGRAGQRADLSNWNLVGLNLDGAELSGANLVGANMARCSLRGAKLICADLRGANLSAADIHGADFRGAMLDQAFGFMPAGSV